MNYYVIQVETRGEEKYLRLAEKILLSNNYPPKEFGRLIWPRRKLSIRKRGIKKNLLAPIFPGYVFWESEEVIPEVYWILRKVSGFYKFLKTNQDIEPLPGGEKKLLLHFMSFGEVADKSIVMFDENSKIKVLEGPMKGLEGKIISVNKRKKRAKIKLSLYEDSFLIDFGFELIESAEEKNGKEKE